MEISIAYRTGADLSGIGVFKMSNSYIIEPYFLWMWVSRPEFIGMLICPKEVRYEFFEFDEMCRVKIPLPPIEIQRAIVNIYKCANEAKQITRKFSCQHAQNTRIYYGI